MSDSLQEWRSAGGTVELDVRGVTRRVFVRVSGSGPVTVLLHGFPASSFEWVGVEPDLARHHTVVAFDFLGYGATDKPVGHHYSVFEQADATEALLAALEIRSATLVAYDYGAIIASELLARHDNRAFSIDRCVFLNAGLYAHLYRPRLAQRLSVGPVTGRLLAYIFSERLFIRAWSEVFSDAHPLDRDVASLHYRALRDGAVDRDLNRRLLRYIPERVNNRERLEAAVAATDTPLTFLWGMRDPVSGSAIASALRLRRPSSDLVEYADVGHCPHIEIPARVAADILARTAGIQL